MELSGTRPPATFLSVYEEALGRAPKLGHHVPTPIIYQDNTLLTLYKAFQPASLPLGSSKARSSLCFGYYLVERVLMGRYGQARP